MSGPAHQFVLGAATGYDLEAVLPFVLSLKKTGYAGRICLFVWDLDPKELTVLGRLGVELRPCATDRTDKTYTVTGGRFFVFADFLRDLPAEAASQVVLTDVRDVVFQRDPFADLATAPGLHCFLERTGYTLGAEPFNAEALLRAYGPSGLAAVADRPISCVGVTLGDLASIRAYLARLTRELAGLAEDFFGSDQAAHNRILYTETGLPRLLHANETGPVLHMGLVPPEAVVMDALGRIVNAQGQAYAVLHQYDRHPQLQAHLLRKYL